MTAIKDMNPKEVQTILDNIKMKGATEAGKLEQITAQLTEAGIDVLNQQPKEIHAKLLALHTENVEKKNAALEALEPHMETLKEMGLV